ncbi:MAG: ubiG 2 [Firmicutes bacterium]|nr:ubiG 2 [Bacillota bacterium]
MTVMTMTPDIMSEMSDWKAYSPAGTSQEINFICEVLQLSANAKILDLYCGYGRHAIELAKLGYQVTGLDVNQDFLDIARQKAIEAGVKVDFRHSDMRNMQYDQQFDAIINMFVAFGYFTDTENCDVIKKVADALKPGGYFLIDLLNREWMICNNLNRYWRHPSGEYVLAYKIELQKGMAIMRRELTNQITGAKTRAEFVLRAYSMSEMTGILERNGLSIVHTYGGFDGGEYTKDTPRMIILAKKNRNSVSD